MSSVVIEGMPERHIVRKTWGVWFRDVIDCFSILVRSCVMLATPFPRRWSGTTKPKGELHQTITECSGIQNGHYNIEAGVFSSLAGLPLGCVLSFLDEGDIYTMSHTTRLWRSAMSSRKMARGEVVCSMAAEMGYINRLDWLIQGAGPRYLRNDMFMSAARGGKIDSLEWCMSKFPEPRSKVDLAVQVAHSAAAYGQVGVLDWLLGRGWHPAWELQALIVAISGDEPVSPIRAMSGQLWTACAIAVRYGHMHVLDWSISKRVGWGSETVFSTARKGRFDLLLHGREMGVDYAGGLCRGAAEGGYLEDLELASRNGCRLDKRVCYRAARGGQLDALKWARDKGCRWDEITTRVAARYGHLEVLRWAVDNGCTWDRSVCYEAAHGGHLDVLKWARERGCDWDGKTCRKAAKQGHLDVLKWATENGCPWDTEVCPRAAESGHLHVLKWAKENGHRLCQGVSLGAIRAGRLDILEWAIDNGATIGFGSGERAAQSCRLDILKRLVECGHPISPQVSTIAAGKGDLDTLKWIIAEGFSWDRDSCMEAARSTRFYWKVYNDGKRRKLHTNQILRETRMAKLSEVIRARTVVKWISEAYPVPPSPWMGLLCVPTGHERAGPELLGIKCVS